MNSQREENVLEVVADDVSLNAHAAGEGTETFALEDIILVAPSILVGECGGSLGFGLDMGSSHKNWRLGIGRQGKGTRADEILC